MKSIIKIFLLTLLTCCYINTVFEFSDTEKKTNFENETHCYISQDFSGNSIQTVKQIQNFNFVFDLKNSLIISTTSLTKNENSFQDNYFIPPQIKRFLLYRSLLI